MKFEIINGKLCRMVEPTPLTPDSTFPCVAKFIFDDTPMGRCNKAFRPGAKDMVYLVDGDHGVNTPEEIFMCDIEDLDRGGEYNMAFEYEIIGYPVDRGSAAWAMWQWMNGKGVVNKGGLLVVSNKAANEYDDKTWEIISSMPDGWAIRESQPLDLRKAEVGDICTRRDGGKSYVTRVDDTQMPIRTSDNLWYHMDGRIDVIDTPNDIVRIEKPQPIPELKERDWVEIWHKDGGSAQHHRVDAVEPNIVIEIHGTKMSFSKDGESTNGYWNITRKLDPIDVVIPVTLEGTVAMGNEFGFALLSPNAKSPSWIALDALDAPTRELVESLLKAQEGE